MACLQPSANGSCFPSIVSHFSLISTNSLQKNVNNTCDLFFNIFFGYQCRHTKILVAPTIVVRQDDIYASFGQKAVLECISDSHPNSFNFWLDPSGKKIIQGTKKIGFKIFSFITHVCSYIQRIPISYLNFVFH